MGNSSCRAFFLSGIVILGWGHYWFHYYLLFLVTFLHPKINICALLRLQLNAKHSSLVGAYQLSASVVDWEPANTRCHPSGQHVGALVAGKEQYFCNNKYPNPSLLQSVWRHSFVDIKCFDSFMYLDKEIIRNDKERFQITE